ncbi:MAG: FGGY family carbohydrate kinase [Acidimicrobiia bacterium]
MTEHRSSRSCTACPHGPVRDANGTLRWKWERLLAEVDRGLDLACAAGPVASIGVDTWAIDYGLVDAHGTLIAPPVSYRDDRTANFREVVDRIGEARLYEISGLQLLPFNTIFQLAAEDRDLLARAERLVMLPELVVAHLTGVITCEMTSAGCTGLLDLATGDWSDELCAAIDLPRSLLPDILEPGTRVGEWRGIPVHLVGGHDTASAVLGGALRDEAFVSAGTWLLVGREQAEADTSDVARLAGFTNEQAAFGGIRFLRNVAGWWLVEECRRVWGDQDLDQLLAAATALPQPEQLVDATDDRFLAPVDMAAELCDAAGIPTYARPEQVTRVAVESMAASTARVVGAMPGAEKLSGIRVFGGGSRAQLYLDALRRHTDLPVSIGPVEATALGNALAQGIGLGIYPDAEAARASLSPEVSE